MSKDAQKITVEVIEVGIPSSDDIKKSAGVLVGALVISTVVALITITAGLFFEQPVKNALFAIGQTALFFGMAIIVSDELTMPMNKRRKALLRLYIVLAILDAVFATTNTISIITSV